MDTVSNGTNPKFIARANLGYDYGLEGWEVSGDPGMVVVTTDSMRGYLLIPKSELVEWAAALGVGDYDHRAELDELRAARKKLEKVGELAKEVRRSAARWVAPPCDRRTPSYVSVGKSLVLNQVADQIEAALADAPELPTEVGAGVMVKGKGLGAGNPFELRKFSDGKWYTKYGKEFGEETLAGYTVVEVL